MTNLSTKAPLRPRKRRDFSIDLRTPQGNFAQSTQVWNGLSLTQKAGFNSLAGKMQQAGLFPVGARQSGFTLFMQMSRAARTVNPLQRWTIVPTVPAPPPAPPAFTVAASFDGVRTRVYLQASAFPIGCQVWVSQIFAPGCRDPLSQRLTLAGALPAGWPEGGVDITAVLGRKILHAPPGGALVVKIVPVSPDGFVGPSLSEMGVVGE